MNKKQFFDALGFAFFIALPFILYFWSLKP